MKLADSIFQIFHEKERFTLKQAYEALPDSPQTTVRARTYDNLGILFKRVGKGIYAAIEDGQECILIEGDGRELFSFRDESVDCIITDHPWKDPISNKGGNRSFAGLIFLAFPFVNIMISWVFFAFFPVLLTNFPFFQDTLQ